MDQSREFTRWSQEEDWSIVNFVNDKNQITNQQIPKKVFEKKQNKKKT